MFHSVFSFSQTWPKYYGEPEKYDLVEDIIETYDKGYLMCGNINNYSNGTSMNGWLIKTDINGDVLWEKIFENELQINKINAIEQTNDGGFVICGSIRKIIDQSQPFVVKLSTCGEIEWCKLYSTPETNAWAQDIKETPTGDIIVLVNQFGENNVEDMSLFKLSAEGETLWKKAYCSGVVHPEGALPIGYEVLITYHNEYLIAGQVYWADPWNPGGPKPLRPMFVLVDSIGLEKWVLPFGLQDSIHGEALGILKKDYGNFVGVGYSWPNQGYDEGLIMEFDVLGNEVNCKIVNAKEIDTNFNRVLFYDGIKLDTSIVFGGTIGIEYTGSPTMEAISDTNLFNNITFSNSLQHSNFKTPYSFSSTFNKKLLSNSTLKETGNWDIALSKLNLNLEYDTLDTGNYTYDSLCDNLPIQSGFINLDGCIITGNEEIPTPEEYFASIKLIPIKAYPNPVTEGNIAFEFENTEHHNNMELRCFDNYGRAIHRQKIYRHQIESKVNIGTWKKGIYIAVLYSNGLVVGQCQFVVH